MIRTGEVVRVLLNGRVVMAIQRTGLAFGLDTGMSDIMASSGVFSFSATSLVGMSCGRIKVYTARRACECVYVLTIFFIAHAANRCIFTIHITV